MHFIKLDFENQLNVTNVMQFLCGSFFILNFPFFFFFSQAEIIFNNCYSYLKSKWWIKWRAELLSCNCRRSDTHICDAHRSVVSAHAHWAHVSCGCSCGEWKDVFALFHGLFIFQRNVIKALRSFPMSAVILLEPQPLKHGQTSGQFRSSLAMMMRSQLRMRGSWKVVDTVNFNRIIMWSGGLQL